MAKAIMVQGTMSNAGKSLLAAALVPHLSPGRLPGGALLSRRTWRSTRLSPRRGWRWAGPR